MKHCLRLLLSGLVVLLLLPCAGPPPAHAKAQQSAFTSASTELRTWWHDNYEFNATSPTQEDRVRRSSFYDVKVATAADPGTRYDSFAYMSIPRSGKGKPGYTEQDGAEFSSSANLSMSWSSFEYSTDVWVDVKLTTGQTTSAPATYTWPGPTLGDPSLRRDAGSTGRSSPSSLDSCLALAAACQVRRCRAAIKASRRR